MITNIQHITQQALHIRLATLFLHFQDMLSLPVLPYHCPELCDPGSETLKQAKKRQKRMTLVNHFRNGVLDGACQECLKTTHEIQKESD